MRSVTERSTLIISSSWLHASSLATTTAPASSSASLFLAMETASSTSGSGLRSSLLSLVDGESLSLKVLGIRSLDLGRGLLGDLSLLLLLLGLGDFLLHIVIAVVGDG